MFVQIKKYWFLLSELVKKGIKLKYRKSYLGILWSLIEPLLTTIVLVIVFGTLFNNKDATYPLYIVIGRLIYGYFSEGTKNSLKSMRANAGMIKKVYVPKVMYPLSSCIYTFIIFLISFIVLIGVDIYCKVVPSWKILMIFPTLLILFLLTFSIGFFLSILNVFFRDIQYLWNVFLMIIMYMSAIFYYPEKLLISKYAYVLIFNPLFQIITAVRACIIGNDLNYFGLLYSLVFSIVMFLISSLFYAKSKDKFILHL